MWTSPVNELQGGRGTAELEDGRELDGLMELMEIEALVEWAAAEKRRRQRPVARDRPLAGEHPHSSHIPTESGVRVGLVLYMSAGSPHAQRALDVVRGVTDNCEPGLVKLTIVDLSKNPHQGTDDKIAYTPTLVKVFPGPKAWVVGNLENPQVLLDLLREYVVDCTDGRGNGHEHLSPKKPSIQ